MRPDDGTTPTTTDDAPAAPAAASGAADAATAPSAADMISAPFPITRHYRSDARYRVSRRAAEELLESLTAAANTEGADGLRMLVVVAHPDDEAIGAGALLRSYKDAIILHVTDGGGVGEDSARRHGFLARTAYARARRAEVVEALRLVGIEETNIRSMGIEDGAASRQLVDVCRSLMDVFDELSPDVVLTHPYEGGHTDHDATAFAVHLACGVLRREGAPAPLVLELASYHLRNGERVRGEFLPNWKTPMRAVRLSLDGKVLKARMFDRFVTQRECLSEFPIDIERFRVAPRYLFTEPPHEGPLDYERHCVTVSGAEWRAQAEKALEMLRARRRVAAPRAD